jgi:FkbM family methyltransferase
MTSSLRNLIDSAPALKRFIKESICWIRREPPITWETISDTDIITLLGKDDPVILDIGSNDGTHTAWFLELFKKARIYSFEPDPRARARYLARIDDPRAVLFDLAISGRNGHIDFYVSSGTPPADSDSAEFEDTDWDQSGSIRAPKKHLDRYPWCRFDEKIVVPTKTLDDWAEEQGIRSIDLIWADVQGAEGDLIAGGTETLRKTRYFYTEYSNSQLYEGQLNLRELLSRLPDFKVQHRYEKDVLLKNKSLG